MPGTGAVAVNSGATLIPAASWAAFLSDYGAWFEGQPAGEIGAAPTFNVLGDLTLAAGSTVDFTFDAAHSDKLAVGGALGLPTSGNVAVTINDLGGLTNGASIFTFGSLANSPFNSSSLAVGAGSTAPPTGFAYGFARNGGEIDLLAL